MEKIIKGMANASESIQGNFEELNATTSGLAEIVSSLKGKEVKYTSATVPALRNGSYFEICSLTFTKRNTKYLILGQTEVNVSDSESIISCGIYVGSGVKSVIGLETTRGVARSGGGLMNARVITTHDDRDSTVVLRGYAYSSKDHQYTGHLIAIEL